MIEVTNKLMRQIASEYDVEVYFKPRRQFCKIIFKYTGEKLSFGTAGVFISDNTTDIPGYPEYFVWVNSKENKNGQVATLLHEIGHFLCYKSDCKCRYMENEYLSEAHAYLYSLQQLKERGLNKALKKTMRHINEKASILNYFVLPQYHFASKMVIESDIWKECEEYLKKQRKSRLLPFFRGK